MGIDGRDLWMFLAGFWTVAIYLVIGVDALRQELRRRRLARLPRYEFETLDDGTVVARIGDSIEARIPCAPACSSGH